MLIDPRKYTVNYPKTNSIINLALQVLQQQATDFDLAGLIADILRKENDALINVALNLAPNAIVCTIIWQALQIALNQQVMEHDTQQYAELFAIPIVLVAGSNNKTTIPGTLEVEKLNAFFTSHGVFTPGYDTLISGKLIEPQALAKLKPSQLYHWVRNTNNAQLWLPWDVAGSAIEVVNEGVFLRFLVGVSVPKAQENIGLKLQDGLVTASKSQARYVCPVTLAFDAHKMEFMQLILAELTMPNVTLFPIPCIISELSAAFTHGEKYRTEIAIQVALSNMTRQIRSLGQTPCATISTQDEAIKITLASQEDSNLREVSLWHLRRFDDFTQILTIIHDLLTDMGVQWQYAA